MSHVSCYQCHKDTGLENGAAIFRSTECPHCMCDLRCCRMCRFYDPKSYNECRETQAERITEKTKANFCGFFEFGNENSNQQKTDNLLNAAEALFKK